MYVHASEKPFQVGDTVKVIDTQSDCHGLIGTVEQVTPPKARACSEATYIIVFPHPVDYRETFRCEQLELA